MNEYRIVEREFTNGDVRYQVQKTNVHNQWDSIVQMKTLDEARDVVKKKKEQELVKERVVE